MQRIPLADFLRTTGITQLGLARMVGMTQGAINQMLKSGRDIYVVTGDNGLQLEERKSLGRAGTA